MWEQILPIIVPVLAAVVSALGGAVILYIRKWSNKLMEKHDASEAERKAVEALMEGIEHAQESLVNEIKKSAADGKLSKEERKQALDLAIDHAKSVAKDEALDLLKASSKERLGGWAKQILAKWSK